MSKAGKVIILFITVLMFLPVQPARASDDSVPWKEEFERICSQTVVATSLSNEQLLKLIDDGDTLLERLEKIKDPWAKIYIQRLKKCQEFFRYTLEWQEKELQVEP
jgi:hypothetical protein